MKIIYPVLFLVGSFMSSFVFAGAQKITYQKLLTLQSTYPKGYQGTLFLKLNDANQNILGIMYRDSWIEKKKRVQGGKSVFTFSKFARSKLVLSEYGFHDLSSVAQSRLIKVFKTFVWWHRQKKLANLRKFKVPFAVLSASSLKANRGGTLHLQFLRTFYIRTLFKNLLAPKKWIQAFDRRKMSFSLIRHGRIWKLYGSYGGVRVFFDKVVLGIYKKFFLIPSGVKTLFVRSHGKLVLKVPTSYLTKVK